MQGQFQVYKKTGALQARLIPYNPQRYKSGAFYFEVSKCVDFDNKTYDWDNKIKFAVGISDICQIFDKFSFNRPQEIRLFHISSGQDDGDKKTLTLKPGEGRYEGTWSFFFDHSGNKVMVPVSKGEMIVIMELLKQCIPAIVGFDTAGLRNLEAANAR